MKNKYLIMLVIFASVFWIADKAFADRRSYVWTYEYKTEEKGEAELEYYLTFSTPNIEDIGSTMSSEHQIELAMGITDRLDFAIYQIFEEKTKESFKYKGLKLRSRYKIGEKGKYILDPLIYLEYKGTNDFSEHEIELKLILAKDIGKFNVALNPTFEFERKDEWKLEAKYAIGASYKISRLISAGLEVKGSENGHYIGPVISLGKGHLRAALGSAFKIGEIKEGEPELQVRMILGVGF